VGARKPRPIVGRFRFYADREKVREKSYDDNVKRRLKEIGQGVGIQWPQQVREARKAFFPIIKEERNKGNTVHTNGNKLYVNNTLTKKYINGKVCDACQSEMKNY